MLINEGWRELEALTRRLASDAAHLCYVPNMGNAGDALIAAAAWQFFEDLGVQPRLVPGGRIETGDSAIYAGGGNLIPKYGDCSDFLERCLRIGTKEVLVLPHTIREHADLLARLDGRFTLACRDRRSLDHVRATAPRANAILAPDMALRLDVERLRARCSKAAVRASFFAEMMANRRMFGYLRWRRALAGLCIPPSGDIEILRTDAEAVASIRGDARWDVSSLYVSRFESRNEADIISRDLLAFVGQARTVRTNRLHAGIAAALVGCPVTFLDNSYGKIGAVYETSLKGVPGVSLA